MVYWLYVTRSIEDDKIILLCITERDLVNGKERTYNTGGDDCEGWEPIGNYNINDERKHFCKQLDKIYVTIEEVTKEDIEEFLFVELL